MQSDARHHGVFASSSLRAANSVVRAASNPEPEHETLEDTMNATRWTAMIASVLTLSANACAGNGARTESGWSDDATSASRSVAVVVNNNNYWDMKVYAMIGSSVPVRIGTVTGNSSIRLTVPPALFSTGTLRLVASQIGGRDVADSGPLQVLGGQAVTFTIQAQTATSFAFVR
jgi:hypothetical protein